MKRVVRSCRVIKLVQEFDPIIDILDWQGNKKFVRFLMKINVPTRVHSKLYRLGGRERFILEARLEKYFKSLKPTGPLYDTLEEL